MARGQRSPGDAARLLAGEWRLVYTSSSQALGVLGAMRALVPLLGVGDIRQSIQAGAEGEEVLAASNKVRPLGVRTNRVAQYLMWQVHRVTLLPPRWREVLPRAHSTVSTAAASYSCDMRRW